MLCPLHAAMYNSKALPLTSNLCASSSPPPQFWEVRGNEVDIAVTPSSNKAFLFWRARGVQKDTQQVKVGM